MCSAIMYTHCMQIITFKLVSKLKISRCEATRTHNVFRFGSVIHKSPGTSAMLALSSLSSSRLRHPDTLGKCSRSRASDIVLNTERQDLTSWFIFLVFYLIRDVAMNRSCFSITVVMSAHFGLLPLEMIYLDFWNKKVSNLVISRYKWSTSVCSVYNDTARARDR